MTPNTFALTALALLVAACSSPPKPPTVDDSKKRPVNVSQAVDLQMCRSELTAAKIVLTETLTSEQRRLAVAAAEAAPTSDGARSAARGATAAEPNQIFVISFPLGSADIAVAPAQSAQLIEQARAAKFIVIRGRTDALSDSAAETKLARRRAEAAYKYLVEMVPLPAEGIRLSWQGAGDLLEAGNVSGDRQASRRVEIELYPAKPDFQWVTLSHDRPQQARAANAL